MIWELDEIPKFTSIQEAVSDRRNSNDALRREGNIGFIIYFNYKQSICMSIPVQ